MTATTLEELAKRMEAAEKAIAILKRPTNDWQGTVGMFDDSDFMREVDAEVLAMREEERRAAREDLSK